MNKIQEMLVKMLKKDKFFEKMSDDQISKFASLFKLWIANKWQAIIIEWQLLDKIYVAKKWKFIAKKANWLNSIILWEIEEWEVFWEMSFFYNKPAVASVVCDSNTCNYWEIDKDNFKKFLKDNPEVEQKITEELIKREKENKEKLWNQVNTNITNNIEINL